jgi:hypothetical protein
VSDDPGNRKPETRGLKCEQSTNIGALRWKISCETNGRRLEYDRETVWRVIS